MKLVEKKTILTSVIVYRYLILIEQNLYNSRMENLHSFSSSFMSIDCLHNLFKEIVVKEKVSCTLPWIQSMQGISRNNTTTSNLPTCNKIKDFTSVYHLGDYFTKNASAYLHPKCPGKC